MRVRLGMWLGLYCVYGTSGTLGVRRGLLTPHDQIGLGWRFGLGSTVSIEHQDLWVDPIGGWVGNVAWALLCL